MKLNLDKSGKFNTWFLSGNEDRKCGAAETTTFVYDVTIEGSDSHLTREGFLIENSLIQQYFDFKYRLTQPVRSCEQIACDAAKDIARLVKNQGSCVYMVKVTIHGTPGAKLSATWLSTDKM